MTIANQHWDPDRYRQNAGFVAELGMPVVELLAPQRGERILDLGCGDGALTAKLAAMGCVVTGCDASVDQIRKAREDGLDAHVMDGQALTFEGEFDAVFSNAALHWMKKPDAVISGVAKALKPGGRFVGEFGGAGNVQTLRTALRTAVAVHGVDPDAADPWYFPTVEDYRARLEAAGFNVRSIELIERPTPLPGDVGGWLATFGESFLNRLDPTIREGTVTALRASLRPVLTDPDGVWIADYVRLRFSAVLA
ncbi:methyltransferase domain-containing protein [Rhodospirillaceae bacterium KN72]|uniref:Methyltransferase domain-containing protein n=1 Tax=Pacificispira spongiicola TaxID=2729598 RepID=A0A7Y0E373_9PROT|nr:methyltransferase domain-containing protein [Pacificispira spongiicola]NMM46412.1 methyltransferase domain-containing protein [Pacificispira spongiicola]